MATSEKAPIGDDGFTMDFTLDVVSDISQDVEDIARQGALGNFRKARSMYKEALEQHRHMFPVYAEYLRLCFDGGDWASLANASNFGDGSWSDSATSVVDLLNAAGTLMVKGHNQSSGYTQAATNFAWVYRVNKSRAEISFAKAFSDGDNEEVANVQTLVS
jgi:hypothetical protein